MGNKCCKTKVTDSVKVHWEPRTIRGRLFRALGCGKLVASVAVDGGINKSIAEIVEPKNIEATPRLFLRLSISDLIRRDKDAFFSTSSLIDMFNNDEKEYDEYIGGKTLMIESREGERSQNKGDKGVDINFQTIVDGGHAKTPSVSESKITEQTDQEDTITIICTETGEEKSYTTLHEDGREKSKPYSEDTHHSIDEPETVEVAKVSVNDIYSQTKLTRLDLKTSHGIKIDEGNLEAATSKEMATKLTTGEFSILTNQSVFHCRPLSSEFFSAQNGISFLDFGGDETVGEVEEEIIAENGDDDQYITDKHCLWTNSTDRMPVLGRGEVSLQLKDVQAAISRLAYLKDGLDPLMEKDDIDNETAVENRKVIVEYQVQKEFNDGLGQSSQKLENGLNEGFGTVPRIIVSSNEREKESETETSNNTDITKSSIRCSNTETNDVCQMKSFYASTRRKSDSLPSPNVDQFVKDVQSSASEPTVEVERAKDQEDDTKSMPVLSETVDKSSSLSSIKGNISIATAISLEALKCHNSRSDCVLSVYVRSANSKEEPRKIDIRATSRQVKDGTAEKHVKLLEGIHLPPKLHGPIPEKSRLSREHLYTTPSVAEHEENKQVKWTQREGPKYLAKPNKVPAFHESTAKTQNSRERLGLERLQKYKIKIQCKAIERIKIDADEFPGILPPSIRDKYRQKMDKKKHMN